MLENARKCSKMLEKRKECMKFRSSFGNFGRTRKWRCDPTKSAPNLPKWKVRLKCIFSMGNYAWKSSKIRFAGRYARTAFFAPKTIRQKTRKNSKMFENAWKCSEMLENARKCVKCPNSDKNAWKFGAFSETLGGLGNGAATPPNQHPIFESERCV